MIYAATKTVSNLGKYAVPVCTSSRVLVSGLVAFIWFCGCGYSGEAEPYMIAAGAKYVNL